MIRAMYNINKFNLKIPPPLNKTTDTCTCIRNSHPYSDQKEPFLTRGGHVFLLTPMWGYYSPNILFIPLILDEFSSSIDNEMFLFCIPNYGMQGITDQFYFQICGYPKCMGTQNVWDREFFASYCVPGLKF